MKSSFTKPDHLFYLRIWYEPLWFDQEFSHPVQAVVYSFCFFIIYDRQKAGDISLKEAKTLAADIILCQKIGTTGYSYITGMAGAWSLLLATTKNESYQLSVCCYRTLTTEHFHINGHQGQCHHPSGTDRGQCL